MSKYIVRDFEKELQALDNAFDERSITRRTNMLRYFAENPEAKKHLSEHFKRVFEDPNALPWYKGPIIGVNIETRQAIRFASRKNVIDAGFDYISVLCCIYGDRKSHNGYVWYREDDPKNIDDLIQRKQAKQKYERTKPFDPSVSQHDYQGRIIGECVKEGYGYPIGYKVYFTGKKDCNAAGFTYTNVYACCKKPNSTHKGFKWWREIVE